MIKTLKITPSKLCGTVKMPSSKSFSHRMMIAAALAAADTGGSVVSNVSPSEDIRATCAAMTALGAIIEQNGNDYNITGLKTPPRAASIDCRESGSTLRFLIPVAAALGCETAFYGSGKLPTRPITPYKTAMGGKGVLFEHTEGVMPFKISGRLKGGEFALAGDVSSQFVTGLLFALPLCGEDSVVKLTSPLESKPYVDMTVSALNTFGVEVKETRTADGFPLYSVKGGQSYIPCKCTVEGDYSQAAFFFVANALGSKVKIDNLNEKSLQGDKKILEILRQIGYNSSMGHYEPFTADVADIPDLVPILAVLGCFTSGVCRIVNAKRLKIKESDRLTAVADALNAIGGRVTARDDSLEIHPVKAFTGGRIDGQNDHRIVMAGAIASTVSENPIYITDYAAVNKSYPAFWEDFSYLGGVFDNTI